MVMQLRFINIGTGAFYQDALFVVSDISSLSYISYNVLLITQGNFHRYANINEAACSSWKHSPVIWLCKKEELV